MTIFFSGHTFKYELEGIVKLFLPVVRFNHIYNNADIPHDQKDLIITRLKKGKNKTYLWVSACLDGKKKHDKISLSNNNLDNLDELSSAEIERNLCILLYSVLSGLTNIKPPWGILTGIRPVSTVQKLRKAGMSDGRIKSHLQEKFLVSDEKLELCLKTADNQEHILNAIGKKSYSLYVSIPFCNSRCSYCSFVSHAVNTKKSLEKVDEYIRLLCIEIEETAKLAQELRLTLETIYIGGGTPTALSAIQLKKVTDTIQNSFDVKATKEYTIEAGRADSITKEKLGVIKNSGATRISINPQTFSDSVLNVIGRNHTAKQVIESFELAREMSFEDINMDLIAGLPSDTIESFKASVDKAISLSPTNITVHTLSIKRSSDLFEKSKSLSTDEAFLMNKYAQKTLINSGYNPYYLYRQKNTVGNLENVGYAKKGYESLYNVVIMDEIQTILACGAGGSTKLIGKGENPIMRIFNYKYHFEYIDRFEVILDRKNEVRDFYARQIQG